MPEQDAELGRGAGAVAAHPRGNMRQVAGGAQGQPPPAAPPGTLAEALIRLQASLPRITKDDEAQVGTRTYRYANLASIHDAVFPLLADCGLYWTTRPTVMSGGAGGDAAFVLAYTLGHVSGDTEDGFYPLPTSGTPQQIGSAITYARRYTLTAVLGIAPAEDDDDGAGAEQAAKASYEERVAAGRMSREQMREHGGLERDVKSSPRKAERISAADIEREREAGDPWASPVEDTPGSITGPQLKRLHALFAKVGAGEREDRLALAMSLLNLPHLGSSNELSFRQAELLARKLEDHVKGDT